MRYRALSDRYMKGYVELIEKLASVVALTASAGLIIGDFLGFLNEYASGFGVIIGFVGLSIKFYFEKKNYQLARMAVDKDE